MIFSICLYLYWGGQISVCTELLLDLRNFGIWCVERINFNFLVWIFLYNLENWMTLFVEFRVLLQLYKVLSFHKVIVLVSKECTYKDNLYTLKNHFTIVSIMSIPNVTVSTTFVWVLPITSIIIYIPFAIILACVPGFSVENE